MEWISVKDRLPDKDYDVLVIDDDGKMAVSRYFLSNGNMWIWENRDDQIKLSEVTHWMPLPNPPKRKM